MAILGHFDPVRSFVRLRVARRSLFHSNPLLSLRSHALTGLSRGAFAFWTPVHSFILKNKHGDVQQIAITAAIVRYKYKAGRGFVGCVG
eukprot:278939-Prymnesium_polylepis.1